MIDLEIRHLRSFLAVAEERSITRAAVRLNLTQQAVSGHLQHLERTLGTTLMVRTSRGVSLNQAGHELATGAKAAVDDLDALTRRVAAVAAGRTGRLRLVCKPHATAEFAVEVAEAMESAVPDVEIELVTVSTLPEELRLLSEGEADAAFLWLPTGDDGLRYAEVRTDPRMVALPEGHPLADRPWVTLADLADEPVIVPQVVASEAVLRHWLCEPRPDGRPALRGPATQRIEDRLMLVARGRGVWLAPEPLSRYFPTRRIRWLPVRDAAPSELALVWTSRAPEAIVARLVTEVRRLTGWTRPGR
ncbi:LysR family transcriptional regulator [Rugosimonospora africana]|uniref:LysR family transcriptional regulator n=1 Tax=Rugosimonospora africana TaxID=556532 RepID=A0A8J3QWL8_9ACTN|nr:LysR family transcriptional regulator [Rugosimonospora africana]GIH17714.1 LysR family transcriptional regulator [Rugosimonospora africana]